jgi:hypothetical protein
MAYKEHKFIPQYLLPHEHNIVHNVPDGPVCAKLQFNASDTGPLSNVLAT